MIGGGISASFPRLEARAIARLRTIVPMAPPVIQSSLGTEAVAAGAIDAALEMADSWLLARIG